MTRKVMWRPRFCRNQTSPWAAKQPSTRCRYWLSASTIRSAARPKVSVSPGSTWISSPRKSRKRLPTPSAPRLDRLAGRGVGTLTLGRLRAQSGEEDHVTDRRGARQQHDESVHPDAESDRRRQAVVEGPEVVGVDRHRLGVAGGLARGLVLEAGPLVVGVGQLREPVAQLATHDDGLEALG